MAKDKEAFSEKGSDNRTLRKKLNDPDYQGEEPDDKLKNGPVMKRRCTDCLCYLIFVAFVGGMFVAAVYGWAKGDVWKLLSSWESENVACGHNTRDGYDYLYFKINQDASSSSWASSNYGDPVCVKTCPTGSSYTSVDCASSAGADCSVTHAYATSKLFGRFCIPDKDTYPHLYDDIFGIVNLDWFTPYVSDAANTWQALLISIAAAIVLAFVYLILVYCCAAPIMWISIFASIGASAFFGWYYWDRADHFASQTDNSENWYKAIGVLLWITSGIILILCCCCYDKIRVALAVITAAAHFVMSTKRILFHPILLALCFVAYFAIWLVGAIYIFSVGTISKRGDYPIAEVKWDDTTRYVMLYYFFGLLWINAFFIAMFQFTVAVAAATWYFSYGTDHSGAKICKGICWGMTYHAGSLAFGSFLLALIWLIRIIFEYWRQKMEKMNAGENKCMKCMMCCISCCLDCLNRCIKFITKNAYIQIALTSKSFCFAAIDAFFLILRNVARFGITHAVTWIFLLLGKAVIAGGATFVGYLCVEYWLEDQVDLNNSFVPLIIFFIVTYVIATVFLSIYSMGADTILQCFLLDEELNKGAGGANARPPAMKGLVKELKRK